MKKILLPLAAIAIASCAQKAPEGPLPVIPMPQEVSLDGGIARENAKIVTVVDAGLPPEGYAIKSTRGRIEVRGGSDAGNFYALQTISQMKEHGGVRTGEIRDFPRYQWRGFMLDEARHFSGKERVKFILDEMGRLKMNRFHWHLTDAQGWRIQIKALPLLTEIGAVGTHSDPSAPAQFYTQEDIREIVAYAAERHIMVIPEIDMPGHAAAANRSYPEWNGGGSPAQPDFTFNPGKEGTYAYLGTILREVAELFPGDYIHVGGDEVNYGSEAWLTNSDVKSLMKRENLKTLKDVEGYFLGRIADTVKVLGKTLVAWDDAMDAGRGHDGEIIHWWRHDRPDKLERAAAEGIPVILCPRKPLYFDFVQHDDHEVGRKWDGFCPIEDVYAYPPEDYPNAIGLQANLWSELTHNTDRVDFMVFPRIFALAEAEWTLPENKDYASFSERLEPEYSRLDSLGIYYYDYRDPSHHKEPAGPEIISRQDLRD